jgi:hypothetical protein
VSEMTENERKRRPCAACGKPVGTATIVAGGPRPDAPLCKECGVHRDLYEVYLMIGTREGIEAAAKELDGLYVRDASVRIRALLQTEDRAETGEGK